MTTTPNLYRKIYLAIMAVALLLLVTGTASAQWSPSASPTPTPGTNIYYNSGNVGIGTTSPPNLLSLETSDAAASAIGSNSLLRIRNTSSADNRVTLRLQKRNAANTDETYGDVRLNNAGTLEFAVGVDGDSLTPAEMVLLANGNVGIGTASPANKLDVAGTIGADNQGRFKGWYTTGGSGLALEAGVYGGEGQIIAYNRTTSAYAPLVITAGSVFARFDSASSVIGLMGGNVGIGTPTPGSYKLNVAGDTNVSGDLTVTGNIKAKFQDIAEWVPSSEQLTPGTVVVLDTTKSNQVTSSTVSYDTRVAGVISAQPGIALGESGGKKLLVATTGRVLIKVDASRGAIHIGDLLVTSDVPGLAMKSEPLNLGGVQLHRPGTLIGKALETLEKGSGKILVLLSLQ